MKRIRLPDLMKGIAVVLMVQVHIMELFARQEVMDSTAGKISLFLGGPLAAPVFMAIMGYFVAASKRSIGNLAWRGIKLLGLGLALNLGLNFHLLLGIFTGSVHEDPWHYIFGVDIFFVAGFSVIILALLKKIFRENMLWYIILMVLLPVLTYFIPKYQGPASWAIYIGSFLWMKTSWAYFPVIPWLSYPLLGYVLFHFLKEGNKISRWVFNNKRGLMVITFILLLLTAKYPFSIITDLPSYYHHGLATFLWISIFIGFMALLMKMVEKEWGDSRVLKYLEWTGKEVTAMYVFQWLIIGNLATSIYKTQYPLWLVFWFAGILALSSFLTYFYRRIRNTIHER